MRVLRAFLGVLVGWLSIVAMPSTVLADKRVALVIGNGAYVHATRLLNPANDAQDMKVRLERLSFDVVFALDANSDDFDAAIVAFGRKLVGADIALFFYAGHGLQFEGVNYLLPTDTRIEGAYTLKRKAVQAQDVVDQMERAAKVSLVFLDACRNNSMLRDLERSVPELTRGGTATRGLARMDPRGGNTLIAFATAPNEVASDGSGRNSPFSTALLKHIETPGVLVQEVLTDVTADVLRDTDGRQKPEVLSRLSTKIVLNPKVVVIPPPPVDPKPTPSRESDASYGWERMRESCRKEDLALFVTRYGDTFFGDLAKRRSADIDAGLVCAPPRVAAAIPTPPAVPTPPVFAPPQASAPTAAPPPPAVVAPAVSSTVPPVAPPAAPAPVTKSPPPPADLRDDATFVRQVQQELRRLGCYTSDVDGKWGDGSRQALVRFNDLANASVPTDALAAATLGALKAQSRPVCPPTCAPTEVLVDFTCRPRPVERPPEAKSTSRPTPAALPPLATPKPPVEKKPGNREQDDEAARKTAQHGGYYYCKAQSPDGKSGWCTSSRGVDIARLCALSNCRQYAATPMSCVITYCK